MKNALIIGAGGFVGTHLYEYLTNKNFNVSRTFIDNEYKLLNSTENCYKLDIRDIIEIKKVLDTAKPEYIFHLAAQASVGLSWREPKLTIEINLIGFLNIVEVMRESKSKSRLLAIGSSEEYGITEQIHKPIDEQMPLNPSNPYSISKYSQELLGQAYFKAYDLDIIQTRSFNHIGPGQKEGFVVSDFAKNIALIEKGLSEPILYVGNLDAKRDFTDVRDVVSAYYLLAIKGKKGHVYNVGSNKIYKIEEILYRLKSLSSKDFEIAIDTSKYRPIDVPIIQCDNTKIVKDIGWNPMIDLNKTLIDTMEFWRENLKQG